MAEMRFLFCMIVALASGMAVRADGSKDMYPRSVRGNRAFLVAGRMNVHPQLFNQAAHYAYARAGETVAVASSAQGIGNGRIVLTAPDNVTQYATEIGSSVGSIRAKPGYGTRQAELAGPRVGYDAFEHRVQPGQEGIWKVEFFPSGGDGFGISQPPDVRADADWNQPANRNQIAAWDVSVRDAADTRWVQGRVFFHVLNLFLNISTLSDPAGAFYGRNYVLTRDGYIYRVDGNGSHGINFFYFVNNSGFLDGFDNPSYKSTAESTAIYHNPNTADNARHVTHKMMYSMPDVDMPAASAGAIPGGHTWLYQQTQIAKIESIAIAFIEGSKNHVNPKGAFVDFETNYAGRYKIVLAPAAGAPDFPKREIFHDATVGANRVHWDGLDGQGRFAPGGEYPVAVSVAMVEGEIHFPYLDMEINPQGIIVDRINPDGTYNGPATVYWDDSAIAGGQPSERSSPIVHLEGISSHANGHKWGTYRDQDPGYGRDGGPANGNYGLCSFGNEQAMDTWSYTEQVDEEITETIAVMKADLEVVSVTADRDTIEPEDVVRYTIALRNNGPVDAEQARFAYSLPDGFFVLDISAGNAGCGSLLSAQQNGNAFQALLNLSAAAGCQIVIHIRAATGPTVPDATYGSVEATAGIVRPPGYWDPDATSTDVDATKPGTAEEECLGNCNNIKTNADVFLLEPAHERGALALLKTVRHIDADHSGFQEEGELLEYTFTIRNTGLVPISAIFLADKLLSDQPIAVDGLLQPNAETSLTRQYRITATDVLRKYVENTASVIGKNSRGFAVRDVSGTAFGNAQPTRIAIDARPDLRLLKKVSDRSRGTGQDGQFTIGDKIVYQFEVRHEGDVGVEDVRIRDAKISAQSYSMNPGVLFNQSIGYELTYTITEADIRAGRVENTAVVSGIDQKYGRTLEDVSGQTFADDQPTVTELARPPLGIGDLFEVYQGNATWLDVLANDEKGSSDIDPGSIAIVVQPRSGTLAVDGDKLLYTPTAGVAPIEDKFTYRFADRSRLTGEAEARIVIIPTVPIAVDDRFAVRYNQPITFDPSENDYVDYSEIVPESLRVTVPPKHGTFFLMGDGTVMYTPNEHYTGYDELKYSIRDRNGNWSEEATVLLEITGFFLPNVITPNGDGSNDTFEVLGTYRFDRVELEIIDRFGGSVFRSSDYKNDWQIPGNVSDGTYFYIFKGIKSGEKPVLRRGSVLLVRKVAR